MKLSRHVTAAYGSKHDSTYTLVNEEECNEEAKGYNLIITGYSLGGGIATLITLFLNEQKPEWNIHCYGFAPAATLSENIAMMPEVNELVTSIVFDYDVVPSLSLNSCKRLIKRMNKVLEQVGFDYVKYIAKLSQGMKTSEAARQLVEEYGKPMMILLTL
ncbi:hypothetical protein ENUP19_0014G0001 [Entamoeba nuttalli]|uniref:Fungal lipase-type domain-containing protein n=1 Tax=Entamoeba nuttalli TaxID=412467 RepID=A0ABQ0D8D5_9EUKA